MLSGIRIGLRESVCFLNETKVKEGIKNISGVATCAFGCLEAYDLYKMSRGRFLSSVVIQVPACAFCVLVLHIRYEEF